MANDSTQAGIVTPTGLPPTDGALDDILQPWLRDLGGLDDARTIIEWQEDPPPRPDRTFTWLSFATKVHNSDQYPYVRHIPDGQDGSASYDAMYKQEEIEVRCSVYGPQADLVVTQIQAGISINQNTDQLRAANIAVTSVEGPVLVPEKIKGKWVRRVDLRIYLRRALLLAYPIRDLRSAELQVYEDKIEVVVEVTP